MTRRSQVQILPPLLGKALKQGLFFVGLSETAIASASQGEPLRALPGELAGDS